MQPILAEEQANNDNTYLHVARDQLGLAFEQYNDGDITASKKSLRKAGDWLHKAVTHGKHDAIKIEAEKLAAEIDNFRSTLSQSSEKKDISGFWHKSTSLILRESEQLIHSYINSSNDNTTLKHLLDAKMHFYSAEHDLFVSHDSKDAIQALNDSLEYLAQADAIARPKVEARIKTLIANIKVLISLTESRKNSWKQDVLVDSLDKAINNVTNAESIATPPIKLRLKLIEQNIYQLKLDMQRTNLKARYDSIMVDFARFIKSI
jgi:hypothetical protein